MNGSWLFLFTLKNSLDFRPVTSLWHDYDYSFHWYHSHSQDNCCKRNICLVLHSDNVPDFGKSTEPDQNLNNFVGGQDTSACQTWGNNFLWYQDNSRKSKIWPVSTSQNSSKLSKSTELDQNLIVFEGSEKTSSGPSFRAFLTYWGREIAATSRTTFSNAFFLNENLSISLRISR